MTEPDIHPLAVEYIARLRQATADLPRTDREELVSEVRSHIDEALHPDATESEVRTVLDRLGDPAAIVAEAAEAEPASLHEDQSSFADTAAIIMLLIGGVILPVIGWLIGVALLWNSRVWSVRDKLIGTLILPGGFMALVMLGAGSVGQTCVGRSAVTRAGVRTTVQHCTGGPSSLTTVLFIAAVALPLAGAAYLTRQLMVYRRTHSLRPMVPRTKKTS